MNYFEKKIYDKDLLKQIENQKNFFLGLKKKYPYSASNIIQQGFEDTLAARVAVLLKEPALKDALELLLPQKNRSILAMQLMDVLIERYIIKEKKSIEWAYQRILKVILAVYTEGVVTAPIDGLISAKIEDGFPRLVFSGPIRAAGGSVCGLIVLIAEKLRCRLNLKRYVATSEEVERTILQVNSIIKKKPTQIRPSVDELRFLVNSLPIMIDGTQTEIEEITAYKYLPRIKAPRLRGPLILIYVEGFIIRAKKMLPYCKQLDLDSTWLEELIKIGSQHRTGGARKESESINQYSLSIGRPLLSTENSEGKGLRLRIGSTPTTALSASNVNPLLIDLIGFLNIGTQLIISKPGKATTISGTCSDLDPPMVLYRDGVRPYTKGTQSEVIKILDLGEILFSAGDFIEFNKPVPLRDYCNGGFRRDCKALNLNVQKLSYEQACKTLKRAGAKKLPPHLGFFLNSISLAQFFTLKKLYYGELKNDLLYCSLLDRLVLPYKKSEQGINLIEDRPLKTCFEKINPTLKEFLDFKGASACLIYYFNYLLEKAGQFLLPQKGFASIEARVGRPEAVKISRLRKNKASSNFNSLAQYYPARKNLAFWSSILKKKYGYSNFNLRYCKHCELRTFLISCTICNRQTLKGIYCNSCKCFISEDNTESLKVHEAHKFQKYIKIKRDYEAQLSEIRRLEKNFSLKLVELKKKLNPIENSNKVRFFQPLIKGTLRSLFDLTICKDGSFKVTGPNLPLTHFRPTEVGVPFKKILQLGYELDYEGNPITSDTQIIALKLNDVIISKKHANFMLKGMKFINLLLKVCYNFEGPYYNEAHQNLIGTTCYSISPHTSNGILNRIIGFTNSLGMYSHPVCIAARRRDADGDMDSLGSIPDLYLNASFEYLTQAVGSLMGLPLNLTKLFYLDEVGKQVLTRELTTVTCKNGILENTCTWAVSEMDFFKVKDYLLKRKIEPEEFIFNTPGYEINYPTNSNLYLDLSSNLKKFEMVELLTKLLPQISQKESLLGVLEGHLLPDLRGNFNAYFKQDFKCDYCKFLFSSWPFSKTCVNCKIGKVKPSVYPGMVLKNLELIRKVSALLKDEELPIFVTQTVKNISEDVKFLEAPKKKNELANLLGGIK